MDMSWKYSCWNAFLAWVIMILLYKEAKSQTATHPPKRVPKAGYIQNSAVHDLIIVLILTN